MAFVLFETTESVIEILWDIALAFFVIKLAFIYFLTSFVSGVALSWLVTSQWAKPVRHLTTPQSELVIVPFLFLLTVCWSRFLIVHYDIPRVVTFRGSIGALALVFMVAAECLTGLALYEEGYGDWIFETDWNAGLAFGGLLALFGAMPLIMMALEHPTYFEETWHGHEKKSIVEAVPTVRMKGRKGEEKKNQ